MMLKEEFVFNENVDCLGRDCASCGKKREARRRWKLKRRMEEPLARLNCSEVGAIALCD